MFFAAEQTQMDMTENMTFYDIAQLCPFLWRLFVGYPDTI
jgi:hypothetical protein